MCYLQPLQQVHSIYHRMCLSISSVFWTCVLWYRPVLFAGIFLPVPLYLLYTHHIFILSHFFFLKRSWNSAAVGNDLWRMNYSLFFGTCYENGISVSVSGAQNIYGLAVQNSMDSVSVDQTFCWKEIFHKKYAGNCAIPKMVRPFPGPCISRS
jgi:hypothetical protein